MRPKPCWICACQAATSARCPSACRFARKARLRSCPMRRAPRGGLFGMERNSPWSLCPRRAFTGGARARARAWAASPRCTIGCCSCTPIWAAAFLRAKARPAASASMTPCSMRLSRPCAIHWSLWRSCARRWTSARWIRSISTTAFRLHPIAACAGLRRSWHCCAATSAIARSPWIRSRPRIWTRLMRFMPQARTSSFATWRSLIPAALPSFVRARPRMADRRSSGRRLSMRAACFALAVWQAR